MDGNQEELLEYFGGASELVEPGKTNSSGSFIGAFKVSKRGNTPFWIKIS